MLQVRGYFRISWNAVHLECIVKLLKCECIFFFFFFPFQSILFIYISWSKLPEEFWHYVVFYFVYYRDISFFFFVCWS